MKSTSDFPAPTISQPPAHYHNGKYHAPDRDSYGRKKAPDMMDRKIIAWDMEGMSLSGDDKPQHPVLFGCSAHPESPMVGRKLSTFEMLHYMIDVARDNPHAIHVGYHFRYDANMLLQALPLNYVYQLWKRNHVKVQSSDGWCWTIQYFPGKKFTVTRAKSFKRTNRRASGDRTTITVYDYSAFFGGKAFLAACEDILRDDLSRDDRGVIEHGKQARGSNNWSDMGSVRYYWQREIILIERVFRRFRDVMGQAGFALREWYGPGALANYINAARNIRPHLRGAQITGTLTAEVHEVSKIAFSGGRFEAFQLGRVQGPIYAVDINSAYPYALTKAPSFEKGEWRHDDNPTDIKPFGIYHIEFSAPRASPIDERPMPLFWRDEHGLISYPNHVSGWYHAPEASIARSVPGVRIVEGYYWDSDPTYPWMFLHDMYETRQRLGKDNLLSMPFKLGPNSLYGKYAQTVGWDEKKKLPPKSHALPIAGYTTSMCRAMLWDVMRRAISSVIAVETDSVYMTTDPRTLGIPIGDGLGEWGLKVYDEIVYVQSGMYLLKKDGEWKGVRSRGISRNEFNPESLVKYLRGLQPGNDWPAFSLTTKPRFVGMGAALASREFTGNWCTWREQTKDISFGDAGKRRHHQQFCKACREGLTPWDGPHRTIIGRPFAGDVMSHPRRLPWEKAHTAEVLEIRKQELVERDMVA